MMVTEVSKLWGGRGGLTVKEGGGEGMEGV